MKKLWKNYNLSIVLFVLFFFSWILQTWTGWAKFVADQRVHGQVAQWFGPSGYIWDWGQATMENWQSEFLQLFAFVVLTTFLVHRGSHESKDTDDEMMATLRRIEERLQKLEPAGKGPAVRERWSLDCNKEA